MDWSNCLVGEIPTLNCIPNLFQAIVTLAVAFSGLVALILLIVSGIRFILSAGGKQAEEAKNMATYAIIGLLVVILASVIIAFIANITGAPCIQYFGFSSCTQ